MQETARPVTRFSGAEWASERREIMLVGVGGIGSWLALCLSRIGHSLILVDPDVVDATNVSGGQMYRQADTQNGYNKVGAVQDICRVFGATDNIEAWSEEYNPTMGISKICICGLDNMRARKTVFSEWLATLKREESAIPEFNSADWLFIDGRLTMEMFEIFAIRGNDNENCSEDRIALYQANHLFNDEEAQLLDCTTKQTTHTAMGIAAGITSTLCNHLANRKINEDFREVPFYQRMYYPALDWTTKTKECQQIASPQEA